MRLLCLFLLAGLSLPGVAREPLAAPKGHLTVPLEVLVIGDSNTEIGHITGETARLMEADFGYLGSGYHSLNPVVGQGSGYLPGLKYVSSGGWQPYQMIPYNASATKPYLAPDGTAIKAPQPGAACELEFYGTSADIYWLSQPKAGSFSVQLDEQPAAVVDTDAVTATHRTRVAPSKLGWHRLKLTSTAPNVTLLGLDTFVQDPKLPRAVVHKWGKGWAASRDFVDIDPAVFGTALQELNPTLVTILLGTNDHNLVGTNRDQFASNLRSIAARIRSALPKAKIILVSTFQVNSPWSNSGLKQFVEIFPEVAAETGARFWDMSTWFGPWSKNNEAALMLDGVHVNAAGGAKIAAELYPLLRETAAQPAPQPSAPEAKFSQIPGNSGQFPAKLPGLLAWWQADGPASLDAANRIASWQDPRGTGLQAGQLRPAHRPLRVPDALNGHAAARFDGKGSYLDFGLNESIVSMVFVAKTTGKSAGLFGHPYFNSRPFHPAVVRPEKLLSANYAAPALLQGQAWLDGQSMPVGDDKPDAIALIPGDFHIVTLVPTGKIALEYLGWGGSWNIDYYFPGDIAEVLLFDRALAPEERSQIESYLSQKYALPLNGH